MRTAIAGSASVVSAAAFLTWSAAALQAAPLGGATVEPALKGRDDVVFVCDFEADNWLSTWGGKAHPENFAALSADPERRFQPHSGKALRVRVKKGDNNGGTLQFLFKKQTGVEPDEIYFRYCLRLADDWKPRDGGKLPGIAGTYGKAGWGGRKVNGTDGWSARGLFQGFTRDGKTPTGYYCYHVDQKTKYGDHFVWKQDNLGFLENNRWYCIEQYVKLNTPTKHDGILRGWVDGKPAFERTDLRFRDVDRLKIEDVWINIYYGGTAPAPAEYHLYIDNVVIAKKPIGPPAAGR
jgi:hypothetical protein